MNTFSQNLVWTHSQNLSELMSQQYIVLILNISSFNTCLCFTSC